MTSLPIHCKYYYWKSFIFYRCQCTDSGDGDTKFALTKALQERGISDRNYLISTCTLRNLQACLINAVVNILGEGGLNEKNKPVMSVIKMIHGDYNLQNWQEDGALKKLWAHLSQDTAGENLKIGGANSDKMVVSWCVCMLF